MALHEIQFVQGFFIGHLRRCRDATIVASLEWMRDRSGIRMVKGGVEKRHAFSLFAWPPYVYSGKPDPARSAWGSPKKRH